MFQKSELARLQARKELLVLESSMNRLKLAMECERLRSPEYWTQEAARAVRRHPGLTAALAAAGGLLTVLSLRKGGSALAGFGRLGKLASLAFTVWKLVRSQKARA